MDQPIVAIDTLMTLLGPVVGTPRSLDITLTRAPILVAADGGANVAAAAGLVPRAVIGDLDSVTEATKLALKDSEFIHVTEQDSTDFEKCLQRISAPVILAIGFIGGRIDHEMAVLNTLSRYPDQPVILLGEQDVIFLAPREVQLILPIGTRFSLFPMGKVTGQSRGLHWPIEGLEFGPDAGIGTSNKTSEPTVRLEFDTQKMLIILPIRHLETVISALHP